MGLDSDEAEGVAEDRGVDASAGSLPSTVFPHEVANPAKTGSACGEDRLPCEQAVTLFELGAEGHDGWMVLVVVEAVDEGGVEAYLLHLQAELFAHLGLATTNRDLVGREGELSSSLVLHDHLSSVIISRLPRRPRGEVQGLRRLLDERGGVEVEDEGFGAGLHGDSCGFGKDT